jgi:hypothetical protein
MTVRPGCEAVVGREAYYSIPILSLSLIRRGHGDAPAKAKHPFSRISRHLTFEFRRRAGRLWTALC